MKYSRSCLNAFLSIAKGQARCSGIFSANSFLLIKHWSYKQQIKTRKFSHQQPQSMCMQWKTGELCFVTRCFSDIKFIRSCSSSHFYYYSHKIHVRALMILSHCCSNIAIGRLGTQIWLEWLIYKIRICLYKVVLNGLCLRPLITVNMCESMTSLVYILCESAVVRPCPLHPLIWCPRAGQMGWDRKLW